MRPLLPALLLLSVLSGCLGAQDDPTATTPETPRAGQAPDAATDPAPEPGGADGANLARAYDPGAAPGAALATLALSFEGTTQTFVCVPTALPRCGAALPSDRERYVPDFEGAPLSLRLTLAWDAATPLTEKLVLHVEGVAGCDEACHAMGPSPLKIALDDIRLAEDWQLTLHAFVPCQACDGHGTMMDPGQDFTMTGELLYAPYA